MYLCGKNFNFDSTYYHIILYTLRNILPQTMQYAIMAFLIVETKRVQLTQVCG